MLGLDNDKDWSARFQKNVAPVTKAKMKIGSKCRALGVYGVGWANGNRDGAFYRQWQVVFVKNENWSRHIDVESGANVGSCNIFFSFYSFFSLCRRSSVMAMEMEEQICGIGS